MSPKRTMPYGDPEYLEVKTPSDIPNPELKPLDIHRVDVTKPEAPNVKVGFFAKVNVIIQNILDTLVNDAAHGKPFRLENLVIDKDFWIKMAILAGIIVLLVMIPTIISLFQR